MQTLGPGFHVVATWNVSPPTKTLLQTKYILYGSATTVWQWLDLSEVTDQERR